MKKLRGINLVEVMAVVCIISIVAAITVPRYVKHQRLQKRAECAESLIRLSVAEKAFFDKNGSYTSDLKKLDWTLPQGSPFLCEFEKITTQGFTFGCEGNLDSDSELDSLAINELGEITQITDDME